MGNNIWCVILLSSFSGLCIVSSAVVGAKQTADFHSAEVKEIAQFVLTQLNGGSSKQKHSLVQILEAQKQVVAGTNYYLTLQLNVVCSSSDDTCPDAGKICRVVVWERKWLNERELLEDETVCYPKEEGSVELLYDPEALESIPINDQLRSLALQSLLEIQGGGTNTRKDLVDIVSARKSGDGKIYLTLKVGSSLEGNDELQFETCEVVMKSEVLKSHHCFPLDGSTSGVSSLEDIASVSQESIRTINRLSKSNFLLTNLNIMNVENTVTPGSGGSLTTLQLELGPTFCFKGTVQHSDCTVDENGGRAICHITLWKRPWIAFGLNVIGQPKCVPGDNLEKVTEKSDLVPVTEELIVVERSICAGCQEPTNPNRSDIQRAAHFAVSQIDKGTNELHSQALVQVLSASTQVINGIKYNISLEMGFTTCRKTEATIGSSACQLDKSRDTTICDVIIIERSWLNQTILQSTECHQVTNSIDRSRRSVRSIAQNKLGGMRDTTVDKITIQAFADKAMVQLDEVDSDDNARVVLDVIDAKEQTVAGRLYILQLLVANSTCNERESRSACKEKAVPPYFTCRVKLLQQVWMVPDVSLVESQCNPDEPQSLKIRHKRSVFIIDVLNDEDIMKIERPSEHIVDQVIQPAKTINELANFVLSEIDKASNSMYSMVLVKIANVLKNEDLVTSMNLECAFTTCRKNKATSSKCPINNKQAHQLCNVDLTYSASSKDPKVKFTCTPMKKKLLGGGGHDIGNMGAFLQFTKQYKKTYDTDVEFRRRFKIFRANMRKVKTLQENELGTAMYGATQFADLTEKEYRRMLGLRLDLKQPGTVLDVASIPNVDLPIEFDWRDHKVVTPVKNQGFCGSCWAFSVTGNIEGQYAIKHGNLLSFSEQELVDCDSLDQGCEGGLPENAYKTLEKLGGLESESDYPYEGKDQKCHFNSTMVEVLVNNSVEISKNETEMAQWLVMNGPISIGINANAMQFYFGGVSHPLKFLCNPKDLDHGVLIVGYGVHRTSILHRTLPYWLIKNSWGASWGEQGYYRVYRGDGSCGVNQMATSAQVD